MIATGLSLFGVGVFAMIAINLGLAIFMLFVFEYTTAARRKVGGKSLLVALAVATVSVVAFDVGMVGWMLVLHFNELIPAVTSASLLFLIQIGNVLGFIVALPIVALLLKRGAKVPA